MTSFVHVDQPTQHPGVARAERVVAGLKQLTRAFDGARGSASLLLAAIVAALLVVANQVVDTWTEGHLLFAWIVLWTVAFAALALLATPARRAALRLRAGMKAWMQAQRQAEQDARMWEAALRDPRLMADLSRAIQISARSQRLMRSDY